MARTRSISPDQFTNADLAALSPFHRVLYFGLPTVCDHAGRGDDRPGDLHLRLLPLDRDVDVNAILGDLERIGLLVRYAVDGKKYFEIAPEEWKRQHCHVEEKKREPRPAPAPDLHRTSTVQTPDEHRTEDGGSTGQAPGENACLLSSVSCNDHQKPPAEVASAAKKKSPTAEQTACRKAISEGFADEYLKRAGQPFGWAAKDRAGVATIANACKNDAAAATKLLAEYIARMASDAFLAKNFNPAYIASKINDLRLPRAESVAFAAPGPMTGRSPSADDVHWNSMRTWREDLERKQNEGDLVAAERLHREWPEKYPRPPSLKVVEA